MRRFATSLIPLLLLLTLPAYAAPPHRGGGYGRRPAYGYRGHVYRGPVSRGPQYRGPVYPSPYYRGQGYPRPYRGYPAYRHGGPPSWGPVYTTPPIVGPSIILAPPRPVYVVQPRVRIVRPAPMAEEVMPEEAMPEQDQGSSCPMQKPSYDHREPGYDEQGQPYDAQGDGYDGQEPDYAPDELDASEDFEPGRAPERRRAPSQEEELESWGRDPRAPGEPSPGRPSSRPRGSVQERAPVAPPASNQDGEVSLDAIEAEVLRLTNVERLRAGLPPVAFEARLAEAARRHSEEMAAEGYFSHDSPTPGYTSLTDRIGKAGITRFERASENIAMGTFEPREAASKLVEMWMNSEGHRKNILDPEVRLLGVGTATNDKGELYATQDFSRVAAPELVEPTEDDDSPRSHVDI